MIASPGFFAQNKAITMALLANTTITNRDGYELDTSDQLTYTIPYEDYDRYEYKDDGPPAPPMRGMKNVSPHRVDKRRGKKKMARKSKKRNRRK